MSRNIFSYSAVIASLLATALFAGCGTSNKEGSSSSLANVAKVDEAICAQCHSTAIDPVAGTKIYEAYLASAHYTNNFHTVGCQDCHGGGAMHNGVGPIPYPNPDTAGQCFSCHQKYLPTAHFANYTATNTHPAQYVSTNYQNSCTSCHDPHLANNGIRNGEINTITGQAKGTEHTDWAESGHGKTTAEAWAHYDFKFRDNCNRCHTSTGFITFVGSNYAYPVPAWGTAGDKTHEVLTCKACHTDYNFKNRVRLAGAFTAPYNNGKSPAKFPNVGATNLCIACHTGYESGNTVKAVADFSNQPFVNSHYLAAAGLMYMKSGFVNFTAASGTLVTPNGSVTNYAKTLQPADKNANGLVDTPDGVPGGVTSTHRKLGTPLIVGDHGITAGNYDANGPCVTCHLNANTTNAATNMNRTTSHTLEINQNTYTQVCINCHTFEAGTAIAADGSNFATVFLDPNAAGFQNSLSLAVAVLKNQQGIVYNPAKYPYFFEVTTGKAVVDWTRGKGQAYGMKVLGACFNINLLSKEPAAYAHARSYSRRLVYDTIDFLDDGVNNLSVSNTAVTSGLTDASGSPLFSKGTQAYTGTQNVSPGSPLYAGTSESMVYLIGWSRGTGAWNTPERP
jgi:hypothetical protein